VAKQPDENYAEVPTDGGKTLFQIRRPPSADFERLKRDAPYKKVEVQVSLRANSARLVLVIREHNNPAADFTLAEPGEHPYTDFMEAGGSIVEAARRNGFVDEHSTIVIVDMDSATQA
jgi:hypothetical protein